MLPSFFAAPGVDLDSLQAKYPHIPVIPAISTTPPTPEGEDPPPTLPPMATKESTAKRNRSVGCNYMVGGHYFMTQWILAGNDINFSIAEGDLTGNDQDIYSWYECETNSFKLTVTHPRDPWVKSWVPRKVDKSFRRVIFQYIFIECNQCLKLSKKVVGPYALNLKS